MKFTLYLGDDPDEVLKAIWCGDHARCAYWPEVHDGRPVPEVKVAQIADNFLADAVSAWSKSPSRSCVVMSNADVAVCTMSEAFFQRIRRRIAEGLIQPDGVRFVWVERGGRDTDLQINRYGVVVRPPAGLFAHAIAEAEAILLAAVERGKS